MIGAPAIGALINKLGDKDRWKTEGNRLNKLADNGIFVPEDLIAAMPTKGRSKDELVAIEQARGDAGNVKFAESRKESDLRPVDIIGYATFAENDPEWFKRPMEERLATAQKALDSGAVREHRGTVDVDWTKVNKPVEAQAVPRPVFNRTRTKEQSKEQAMGQELAVRANNRLKPRK